MNIFVISLADAAQRRAQIQSQLSALHLPFSWLEAVDARQWSEKDIEPFLDKKSLYENMNHKPMAGAIGSHLSHMKAYEALLSSTDDAWLILEDDAIISDQLPKIMVTLSSAMKHVDILFLCDRRADKPSIKIGDLDHTHALHVKKYSNLGSTGYVINRRAAHAMLSHYKAFGIEVDCLLNRWWHHRLAVATVKPDLIKDEGAETQIGYDLEMLTRTLPQKMRKKAYDLRNSFLKRILLKSYCRKIANSWKIKSE